MATTPSPPLPKLHDASTIEGSLAYGIRSLASSALPQFQTDFQAYRSHHAHRLHAALAFPEQSESGDRMRLHIVLWYRQDEKNDNAPSSDPLSLSSQAFGPPHNDGDGVFCVYNSGKLLHPPPNPNGAVQVLHDCDVLSGYLLPPPEAAGPADAKRPLPMIGVFKRAVQSGRKSQLGDAFRDVCNIWHATVPGILGALVFADPLDDDLVHDVRIFADKASYDAHVDKSNPDLVRAMDHWFAIYDRSVPHKGLMVAEDTSDPATRTSSIKDKPVRVDFLVCHYGQGNCMGSVLDSDFVATNF